MVAEIKPTEEAAPLEAASNTLVQFLRRRSVRWLDSRAITSAARTNIKSVSILTRGQRPAQRGPLTWRSPSRARMLWRWPERTEPSSLTRSVGAMPLPGNRGELTLSDRSLHVASDAQ